MLAALTARSVCPPATSGAPTDALHHHHQPPKFRPTPSNSVRTRPSLTVLVRTRWRRDRLDEELARGAYRAASGELSLRVAQLPSPPIASGSSPEQLGDLTAGEGPQGADLKPRLPEILSSGASARAIVLDLAAGESLADYEVHERA